METPRFCVAGLEGGEGGSLPACVCSEEAFPDGKKKEKGRTVHQIRSSVITAVPLHKHSWKYKNTVYRQQYFL